MFAVAGFWWFDGYTLVQERYWQGIANDRPFQYWSWANFASVVCAIGLGSVAGIGRAFDIAAIKRRSGLHLVVLGALLAIVFADLSHAEQGRDRTHLAAVHGLAHRRRRRCCRRGHTAGGWRSTSSAPWCSTTSS